MIETKILLYIEASSKDKLVEKMVQNNLANRCQFNYFNPQKDGKKWVVWFKGDLNTYVKPEDLEALDVRPSV